MRGTAAGIAWLFVVPVLAQEVGEGIYVCPGGAKVRDAETVVASVERDIYLKVRAVDGDRLFVHFKETSGWIDRREVVPEKQAIEFYTELIRRGEGTAANHRMRALLYYERAGLYFEQSDLDAAFADLNEAIRLDPKYARAYVDRGHVWVFKRDNDRALADFGQALLLDPTLVSVYLGRAVVRLARGELDHAAADIDEAIRGKPSAYAYEIRAAIRFQMGDEAGSLADLGEVIRLDPAGSHGSNAYARRGLHSYHDRRFGEALADLTEALRIDSESANAHGALAWLLATCPDDTLRRGQEAVRHATIACELRHWKDASMLAALAAAYAECGDFPSAVLWQLRSMNLTHPNDREKRQQEILALYESGKPYRDPLERRSPVEAPKS